ncbi:MAG: hypothetical protein UR91_C0032G0010 [Candidatus Nomurabacteria bacterium GW2011_GWC2_35_8]|uniref:Fimbrial assembly family protein n=1 Tax=Candidatus Nomurabacteria bacterium GW2011_GWC2_35_8 TaxID=1618752 RepID=A0A0G0G875_9BACT|nr:MAG: hypothetical protein UR91_C0032G0010 [Candidatus Nomurabacteria bacterium GW2011_GWC2_35_8]
MKKRINLFKVHPIQEIPILKFFSGRVGLIFNLVGVICFLVFLFFIYLNIRLNADISASIAARQEYLQFLLKNDGLEVKLQYFKSKQNQLNTYAKDDARFLPYYNILVEALEYATNSPSLDSVVIDKDRNTNFVVKLNDFDSAISFLKYVESPIFLGSFSSLNLVDFNLFEGEDVKANKNYQFTFQGAFNEISNNTL